MRPQWCFAFRGKWGLREMPLDDRKVLALVGLVLGGLIVANRSNILEGTLGSTRPDADPLKLAPQFRAKLDRVFARLRSLGFAPVLHEGKRSEQRARELAKKGTGIVKSMHVLGLAADVLPAPKQWPPASNPFWQALGEACKAEGLEWGGTWSPEHRDLPHVQLFDTRLDARAWAAYKARELPGFIQAHA